MEAKPENQDQLNTLEDPDTVIETGAENTSSPSSTVDESDALSSSQSDDDKPTETKPNKSIIQKFKELVAKVNIYFLLFLLIIVVAIIVVIVSVQQSKKENKTLTTTQKLSDEELKKLSGTDAIVGDPKQVLTVESNAIFSGKVLVRDSLEVAGQIKVGGALSLPGLTVAGTSTFEQINANNLSISQNASIQGSLSVQNTLTVSGGASFGGPISAPSITIDTMQLNKDLLLNRHIDAGGGTPGKIDGGALGGGGTSSVSGSDTAGTITINTGSAPGGGTFITVIFSQKFNSTPHVVITPVGSAAAGLNYFVTRTSTSFTIGTTNSAPAFSSFSFDYIVID